MPRPIVALLSISARLVKYDVVFVLFNLSFSPRISFPSPPVLLFLAGLNSFFLCFKLNFWSSTQSSRSHNLSLTFLMDAVIFRKASGLPLNCAFSGSNVQNLAREAPFLAFVFKKFLLRPWVHFLFVAYHVFRR